MLKGLRDTLSKTSSALIKNVLNIAGSKDNVLDEYELEDIEDALIRADLGIDLSVEIVNKIRKNKVRTSELKGFLKQEFLNILDNAYKDNGKLAFKEGCLNIYFVVGINGAGKTTLIGKLSNKFKKEGKKVLIAAGDTFRAAAEAQLDIWAKRAGVDIIRKDKADSAAIVYEGVKKGRDEKYDVLIIDTAGRLQNKFNLIEELKKVKGVITKNATDCVVESILVLDANLGQNGLSQAKVFNEAVELTSAALTKLDGSAKGGMILSIAKEYNLPTKLIGVGEGIDDIKEFKTDEFIDAIF